MILSEGMIYSCVVGWRAYGLAGPGSDTDRRGVYLVPIPMFWGLDKPPSHVDGPLAEQFSWELERCCELGLQANPTVLECLWSPIVERISPAGDELLSLRRAFLSRRVAQSYGGYAHDQLQRLEAARRRTDQVKWKQAMHMLRLLLAGAHVLRTGGVLVDASSHREELLAVKHGQRSWMTSTRLRPLWTISCTRRSATPCCRTNRTGPSSTTSSSGLAVSTFDDLPDWLDRITREQPSSEVDDYCFSASTSE